MITQEQFETSELGTVFISEWRDSFSTLGVWVHVGNGRSRYVQSDDITRVYRYLNFEDSYWHPRCYSFEEKYEKFHIFVDEALETLTRHVYDEFGFYPVYGHKRLKTVLKMRLI